MDTDHENRSHVLEVDRAAPLDELRLVREPVPARQPGAVLLAVERFSLATNNLSYVLINDVLHTLDAFPATTPDRARVPVWGIAEVIDADPSVIAVGTRVSGFLPMATHTAVRATSTETGLLSIDERRLRMLPIYRRLTPVPNDAVSEDPDIETVLLAVYRFAALLAADIVATGARTAVVTSASSRSAAALSRLLAHSGISVVGLTSAQHRPAADSFGVYTQVLDYHEIKRISPSGDTVYVDITGKAGIARAVQHRLGPALAVGIGVGLTHERALPTTAGPPLSMFNTGDREVDAVREHGWQAVQSRYDHARAELIAWASEWLTVTTVKGLAGTAAVWRDIVAGCSDPLTAVVIRP
jgi:hypothetical protein